MINSEHGQDYHTIIHIDPELNSFKNIYALLVFICIRLTLKISERSARKIFHVSSQAKNFTFNLIYA